MTEEEKNKIVEISYDLYKKTQVDIVNIVKTNSKNFEGFIPDEVIIVTVIKAVEDLPKIFKESLENIKNKPDNS